MIYSPHHQDLSMRFHAFGKSSLLQLCLPRSNSGVLLPWRELLFQLSTVVFTSKVLLQPSDDTKVVFTYMSKSANFTCLSSV